MRNSKAANAMGVEGSLSAEKFKIFLQSQARKKIRDPGLI